MTVDENSPDFAAMLKVLTEHQVEFVVVGGVAANLFGSPRLTYDLDIVYNRANPNLLRLTKALENLHPYLRGAPRGLPFKLDLQTLKNGLNFTLTTDVGPLDLLAEIPGAHSYDDLLVDSFEIDEQGLKFRCVTLKRLIKLKAAAGRPKDFEAMAELKAILEELQGLD